MTEENLPPEENEDGTYTESTMPLSEREKLPLHEKILNGMPYLLSACDPGFLKRTNFKKANDKIEPPAHPI